MSNNIIKVRLDREQAKIVRHEMLESARLAARAQGHYRYLMRAPREILDLDDSVSEDSVRMKAARGKKLLKDGKRREKVSYGLYQLIQKKLSSTDQIISLDLSREQAEIVMHGMARASREAAMECASKIYYLRRIDDGRLDGPFTNEEYEALRKVAEQEIIDTQRKDLISYGLYRWFKEKLNRKEKPPLVHKGTIRNGL